MKGFEPGLSYLSRTYLTRVLMSGFCPFSDAGLLVDFWRRLAVLGFPVYPVLSASLCRSSVTSPPDKTPKTRPVGTSGNTALHIFAPFNQMQRVIERFTENTI